jgi:glyoxalase family protein
MVYQIVFRVGSSAAIDFWAARLAAEGVVTIRDGDTLDFADPEGLGLQLVVTSVPDAPLIADHPEIPREMALQGFDGVRAYGGRMTGSRRVLEEVMGAEPVGEQVWRLTGPARTGWIRFDAAPMEAGRPGAGTVHHVAWSTEPAEHELWVERLAMGGVSSTPVIDRHYFRSIYFREPSGVLYELATKGPGFTVDGPLEELGHHLILPPKFELRRKEIEARLTPLPDMAR